MKRLAVLIVMAAALAASCVKEPVDNNFTDTDKVDEGNGTYIYTVKASATPETRSNYDDDGVFSWSDGDAISVLFHNGTQNKFFTLTIDSADAGKKTASFSGAIEDGYEIGASDGTSTDLKIWALFPASDSHTYTIGENPKFYIPEETDYTTTHFSANLPMVSHLTEEGSISFRNYVCAYKFTVTNIDATKAPKIKAVVTNGVNYALSGLVAMGSDYLKMNNEDVDNGASKTVSYICDVAYDNDPTKGTAVFYVASRWSSASFQPTIQIINYSTGLTIKEFVADKASSLSRGQVKPIKLNVSGGDYFIPAIKIDGSFGDWDDVSHVFAANNSGLVEWKYTTDTRNLYFLYKVTTTQIVAEGSTFDNSPYFYIGFDTDCKSTSGSSAGGGIGAGMEAEALIRPWKGASNATPQCEIGVDENGHLKRPISTTLADKPEVGGKIIGDYCYVEVCIPRSALGNPTGPINVKHSFRWSVTDGVLIMPETTTITAEDQTVDEGKTVSIGATTNSTANITYTSNNTAVATVDANGVITGVAEGSTTITLNAVAVAGEYTAASTTINVTVTKPYVPAIVIDGDFTDWTTDIKEGVTIYSFENDNGTGHSSTNRLPRWKATSDERNIYLYYEIGSGKLLTGKNIITGLDLGADGEGGSSAGGNIGGSCEVEIAFAPLTDNSGTTECVEGEVGSINYNGSTVGQVYLSGTISGNAYIEISIPRDKIGSPSSELTINACHSFDWYTTGWHTFNLK